MTNVFDPYNPPRFCPSCAQKGVKSKVKKMKVDPRGDKFIIMCKNDQCPWPLSVMSVDEVTITQNRVVDAVTGEKVDAGEAAVKDPVKAMCALVSGKDSYPVVPQVKVGENGELVLDESSLYIKTTSQSESLDSTNSTWRKKKSHKGWSDILISDSTEDAKEEGGKGGRKSKKKRSRKRYRNRGYYDSSEDEDRNADILTRKSPASQTNKVEIQEEIQMKKIMRPKGLHKYRLNTKSKERLDKTVGEASEPNLSQIVAYGGTQGMSISSTHSKEDEESQGGKINDSSRFEICFEKGFYNPNRHDNNDEEFAPLKLGVAGGLDTKKSCVEKSSDVLLQESIRDLLQCCSTLTIMDDVGEAKEENVEYVPTEQELREDLEGLVFGGYLPKVMRELTPPRTGNSNESSLSQLVNIEDIAFVPKQPRAQVNENYLRKKTFGLEKYFGETCTSNMPSENFEKTHISSKPSEKSKKKRPRKRYRNRGYYDSSEDEDRNAISSKPSEKFTKFDQMFKRRGEKKVTGVASDKEEVKTKGTCSPNSKQYSDDNRIVQTSGLSESSLTDVKGKNVDVNVSEDNVDELLDDSVRIIDGNNNEQEGDKKLTQGDL